MRLFAARWREKRSLTSESGEILLGLAQFDKFWMTVLLKAACIVCEHNRRKELLLVLPQR